jgi:hypothetical protein
VDFLAFFHVGIVLCNATKGEFVHEVDLVRITHVFVLRKVGLIREKRRKDDEKLTLNSLTITGNVALKSIT